MVQDKAVVLKMAETLFQQRPNWVVFFREVMGVGGIIQSTFPGAEARLRFLQSSEFATVQGMLADLRAQVVHETQEDPTHVITIRMPKSLHESLKNEAGQHGTSMNKLCITKLLQILDAVEVEARGKVDEPLGILPRPTRPVAIKPARRFR